MTTIPELQLLISYSIKDRSEVSGFDHDAKWRFSFYDRLSVNGVVRVPGKLQVNASPNKSHQIELTLNNFWYIRLY